MTTRNHAVLAILGLTAVCAGAALTASAPRPNSSRSPRVVAAAEPQQAPPRYPAGLEWLAGPPPPGVGLTLIKSKDAAVGLVVVDGMKEGQTVSTTVVAMPKMRGDSSATEGLVLVDPAGKQHAVSPGKVITFVLGAAPVISLMKGGQTLGTKPLVINPAPGANPQLLVQSNRISSLHGKFDGNAANTTAKIGDTPLKVIAETPTDMIVAIPDLDVQGPMTIQISDNGGQSNVACDAVGVEATGPRVMKLGQRSTVEVVLHGLQRFRDMKLKGSALYAYVMNETPEVATLDKKARAVSEKVDPRKISKEGDYRLRVGLTAVGPGTFRLVGSATLNAQGCEVSCAGCSSFSYCDDKGTVLCSKGECSGKCTATSHKGGAGCGNNLTCDCKWQQCACG